ncbi:hypothetical protein N7541_006845 [Penicillium brevicompactum]|uniref:Major facilitator superfamily (MFS) profile domain-containing protein n=1 Tax=Penicillium brevicompactum TaxID=5074 RepID=A0A9W9UTM4_PENBR|nr:hypothetical protein N7541_006845 [Penicillium brevicompactum]
MDIMRNDETSEVAYETVDHRNSEQKPNDSDADVPAENNPAEESVECEQYPPTWQAVLLTIGMFLSFFCLCLDQTILATALPRITDEFHSLDDIGWYSSSYLVAMSAVKMLWGKLYTFYPAKWMFLTGLFIFEVGSLICGLAPNSLALILGRCIAGLGASSIDSGAIIIITYIVPLHKRAMFMSILGSVRGITAAAGPPLGGVLTDRATWRWCFYINLPCGAITCLCVFILLRPKGTPPASNMTAKEKFRNVDPIGSCLLILGIVLLLVALQWGGSTYPWSSWRVILLLTLSGVSLVIFCGVQIWLKDQAAIPPRIVKDRNIIGALWYVSMSTGALYIFVYYLPLWFQSIKGVTATQSGVMLLPTEVGIVVFALIGGFLVTIVGYYTPLLCLSSILSSTGAGMLSTLQPDSGIGEWLGYQVLLSSGAGLGAQNALLVPQVALPPDDIIMGITLLTFAQVFVGSVALTIGESVFRGRLTSNLGAATSSMEHPLVLEGATVPWEKVPNRLVPAVLEAYNRSISQTFYLGVVMFSLSLLGSVSLQWKSTRAKKPEKKYFRATFLQ